MAGTLAEVTGARWRRAAPLVLLGGVTLAGCSRAGTLNCDVTFEGGDTSSIAVRIIPEKDIAGYLAARKPQAEARLAELQAAVEAAAQADDQALRTYRDEFHASQSASATRDGITITADEPSEKVERHPYNYDHSQKTAEEARTAAFAALDEAHQKLEEGRARFEGEKTALDEARASARQGKAAAYASLQDFGSEVFADLPPGGITVYTDAKGHFTTPVPKRGRYALIADATIKVYRQPQHCFWGVWVDLKGEPALTVRLTANELLLEQPPSSLLR